MLASRPLDLASRKTSLIISNEEMNDIMKIFKSLEESGLLIKGVNEAIQNEAKEQKGIFLSMLLGTLDASLLGNLLTLKSTIRAGDDRIFSVASFFIKFCSTKKYYQNEPKLNCVYSRKVYLKLRMGHM